MSHWGHMPLLPATPFEQSGAEENEFNLAHVPEFQPPQRRERCQCEEPPTQLLDSRKYYCPCGDLLFDQRQLRTKHFCLTHKVKVRATCDTQCSYNFDYGCPECAAPVARFFFGDYQGQKACVNQCQLNTCIMTCKHCNTLFTTSILPQDIRNPYDFPAVCSVSCGVFTLCKKKELFHTYMPITCI